MSSKRKNKSVKICDYDYFTLIQGSNIIDLFGDLKDTAYHNGVNIFSDNMTGNILEDFIFDNCIIKNPYKSKSDSDKRNHNYDNEDIIIRK